MQQPHNLNLARIVKKCRRLVKEYHGSLLCESLGYHRLLPLTVAERLHGAITQLRNAYKRHSLIDNLTVIIAERTPKAGIRAAAKTHKLSHRHIVDPDLVGKHHAYHLGQFCFGIGIKRASHNGYVAT